MTPPQNAWVRATKRQVGRLEHVVQGQSVASLNAAGLIVLAGVKQLLHHGPEDFVGDDRIVNEVIALICSGMSLADALQASRALDQRPADEKGRAQTVANIRAHDSLTNTPLLARVWSDQATYVECGTKNAAYAAAVNAHQAHAQSCTSHFWCAHVFPPGLKP
jgi:hypothetical protein